MKSHFEGRKYLEAVEDWEMQELVFPDGKKCIGVYIKTSDGEKWYTLGGSDPLGWLQRLVDITKAHPRNVGTIQ